MQSVSVRQKWRPPLALVIAGVVGLLLAMPLAAVFGARLADNQFVRRTEESLNAQAALFAESYALAFAAQSATQTYGKPLTAAQKDRRADRYHPVEPSQSMSPADILPPRPEGQPTPRPIAKPYAAIGPDLTALATAAQKTTLAGYVAVDAFGRAIAGSGSDVGYSFGHIPEIGTALNGNVAATLRYRSKQPDRHPLNSISRDTSFRVFVAHPVIVEDRVIGAVLLSRTPLDLRKFLFAERRSLMIIAAVTLTGALLIGALFWRFIARPIHALGLQSQAVAAGKRAQPEPLAHYGVRELADLGQSVLSMAKNLTNRAEAIETYTAHVTHELKSPVTSIVGAAELLADGQGQMPQADRERLTDTIHAEGQRMNALLGQMRDFARAGLLDGGGTAALQDIVERMRQADPGVAISCCPANAQVPLTLDQADLAFGHLMRNARQHGANGVELRYDAANRLLTIRDDGTGISPGNRDKVTKPFFTTRRAEGGTGMGLAIAAAVFERRGGTLTISDVATGAEIAIHFSDTPTG